MSEPLLDVRDLHVSFRTENGIVRAVDGVSFTLEAGHVLGIVGESGSGKSVTVMSIMQLIRDPNAIFEGQVLYKGRDLMGLSQSQMQSVRGAEIAMIFQDPMTSLNPVYKVGWQIEEMLRAHERLTRRAAHARAVDLLSSVGIPSAARRVDDYPHQFSGGMRQRVMIAMALACNPDLLIADEPTTALDVTIQAQILALIDRLKVEYGSAVIVITHDMGVVAQVAETVAVMYAGRIVEQGGVDAVFGRPAAPVHMGSSGLDPAPRSAQAGAAPDHSRPAAVADRPPRGLCVRAALRLRLRRLPAAARARGTQRVRPSRPVLPRSRGEGRAAHGSERGRGRVSALTGEPLLRGVGLVKHFPVKAGLLQREVAQVQAVDGVDVEVRAGETLGLVGESGCGKSTLGRCLVRLHTLTGGSLTFDGRDISRPLAARAASVAPRAADRLPGSLRIAEPAQARRRDHRLAARRERRRAASPGAGADGDRGPLARALQPLSARVLRGSAAADRHRARARAAPAAS